MSQVVTLAEARAYCRISTADDTVLQALLDGAEEWVQRDAGILFGEHVIIEDVDGGFHALPLTRGPVLAVSSVYDLDEGETEDADDYELRGGKLWRDNGLRWDDRINAKWRVTYIAGYRVTTSATTTTSASTWTAVDVPAGIKLAILQLVYRAYMSRGAGSESAAGWSVNWTEFARADVQALLMPYRVVGV